MGRPVPGVAEDAGVASEPSRSTTTEAAAKALMSGVRVTLAVGGGVRLEVALRRRGAVSLADGDADEEPEAEEESVLDAVGETVDAAVPEGVSAADGVLDDVRVCVEPSVPLGDGVADCDGVLDGDAVCDDEGEGDDEGEAVALRVGERVTAAVCDAEAVRELVGVRVAVADVDGVGASHAGLKGATVTPRSTAPALARTTTVFVAVPVS